MHDQLRRVREFNQREAINTRRSPRLCESLTVRKAARPDSWCLEYRVPALMARSLRLRSTQKRSPTVIEDQYNLAMVTNRSRLGHRDGREGHLLTGLRRLGLCQSCRQFVYAPESRILLHSRRK